MNGARAPRSTCSSMGFIGTKDLSLSKGYTICDSAVGEMSASMKTTVAGRDVFIGFRERVQPLSIFLPDIA